VGGKRVAREKVLIVDFFGEVLFILTTTAWSGVRMPAYFYAKFGKA